MPRSFMRRSLIGCMILALVICAGYFGFLMYRAKQRNDAQRFHAYMEFNRLQMSHVTPALDNQVIAGPQLSQSEAIRICNEYLRYWPEDKEAIGIRDALYEMDDSPKNPE